MATFKIQRRAFAWHKIIVEAPDEKTALEIAEQESEWEFSEDVTVFFDWDNSVDPWIEEVK